MRKIVLFCLLAALFLSLPSIAEITFKDVPDNHWANEAVYDLVRLGVTKGYPDGTYRGKNTINRYELAVFLSNLAKGVSGGTGGVSKDEVTKIVKDEIASIKMTKVGASISGLIFSDFTYGSQNSTTRDFEITRTYLTVKNDVGAKAKARVTLDVMRGTVGSDNPLLAYVKYAYVDLQDVMPALNLRIGMQPTYWVGYIDDMLGIRYIAKSLTDSNGVLSSADLGLGANGSLNVMGMGLNYTGAVINGAGYKKSENDTAKTINLQVNTELLPGVTVAGGGQADYNSSGLSNRLLNLLGAYKGMGLASYVEILYGNGALGYTVAGTYDLGSLGLDSYKLIARYDSYDPARATADDQKTTMIVGGSYDVNNNVALAVDMVSDTYGTAASSNAGTTISTINIHSQIKF
ncbi:MAG: S-layer homology domain-containing protein [bacterium]